MRTAFSSGDGRRLLGIIIRKDFPQLIFVFLSFALMVAVSYFLVSAIVEKQILVNAEEALETAEVTIRSDLREAEAALLQTEMLVEEWLKRGESGDSLRSYMELLAGTMRSGDAWVRGLMNIYGIVNDNFMPGLYVISEGYVPESRPWYQTAEAAGGKIGITPPYIDNKTRIPVISFAKTLLNAGGERYGIISLDLDFSDLSTYVLSLNLAGPSSRFNTRGSFGMLCDGNMNFIVHPFASYVGRPLGDINAGYAKLAGELAGNSGMVAVRMLSSEGSPIVITARQIFNGWYLGIACPVSNYFSEVNFMAITLSVLGCAFMITLCVILIQFSLSKARSDEENMQKSSFLARMSHEIRTPMNSILGMAELIQRKAVSSEIQEYIQIIHQAGDNLLAIINDILDFSKIESGRLQIQNRDYFIASVINDMINMVRPRIAEKSLDIFVNVDSGIPEQLYGDDMRLRQILTNLLTNGVKYTRKGFVSLDVRAERLNGNTIKLTCRVEDSGIGIKPEDRKSLFSEFARVDAKANQDIEGTGLGLTITRALCRAMGGDVTFTSEYGKGSVFCASIIQDFKIDKPVAKINNPEKKRVLFYDWRTQYAKSISSTFDSLDIKSKCSSVFQEFIHDLEFGDYDYAFISSKYAMDCIYILGRRTTPLQLVIMVEPGEISVYREVTSILMPVYSITMANVLNDVADGTTFQDAKHKIYFTAPSAKILIVDDISTNLRVAKELMSPYEMNVHTCLSGSEALTLLKNNRFDIVFMDHMMPGMDGIEATSFIRNMESEDGYYQKLPIIALTANALSGQREMFLEHGINDFLAKPIDIQKLDEILERWLPPEKRVLLNQQQRVDTKQEKAEVLAISGVNVPQGLRNCGGGTPVYLNILADFCKDAQSRLVQITEALTQRDTKQYITLVHALKGAARSIGAIETGEKASWLEKAAASGDLAAIKDKTTDLQENVRALINNIEAVLKQREAEDGRELSDVSSLQLEALKKALAEMDIEAVNKILLDYAGLSLDSRTKDIISEVEQHILMFEYEKAIEKINELS